MHIDNHNSQYTQFHSLPLGQIKMSPGFWQERQSLNREVSLKDGYRKLHEHGNFANLKLAAGEIKGEYRKPQFMDSDIYKWLEAAAYELNRKPDNELEDMVNEAIGLLEKVQQPDGYLNSYWQYEKPGQRWTDLETGHELYCAGHLIEAGVALHRAAGEIRLLNISKRVADIIVSTFGKGKLEVAGGHPEVELALVELYRETGDKRYLDMATFFIDQRGKGIIADNQFRFGSSYFQDRVPVREAEEVEGHAVRQLYLASGVTDIYMETGEKELLDAMKRLWANMTGCKMYITGGFGARHEGESFGNSFELPSDRCYCETCATIAAIMWSWRMLLATGEPEYADLIERCLYNGFLSGISLDGIHYFYDNPLQSRGGIERVEWFDCACCPPNAMRLISMIENYAATVSEKGIYLHQYIPSEIHSLLENAGSAILNIETEYPRDEKIKITVSTGKAGMQWSLFLRIPDWCQGASLRINGESTEDIYKPGKYIEIERDWGDGDRIELRLPMSPRIIEPDERIDAIRGSLAIEYGPFVYCIEEADNPGTDIDDVRITPDEKPVPGWNDELAGGIYMLKLPGKVQIHNEGNTRLYFPVAEREPVFRETNLTAVPYFTWANRGPGKMRVWIPRV